MRFFGALLLLLGSACVSSPVQEKPAFPASIESGGGQSIPAPELAAQAAAPNPDCLSEEANPIASSIAADYEFTSYEEVMTWFCSGAAFEDILAGLLTEDLTGTPVEEILDMLASGFTWDEIWQVTGLTEG